MKKLLGWGLVIFIFIGIIGSCGEEEVEKEKDVAKEKTEEVAKEEKAEKKVEKKEEETKVEETEQAVTEEEPKEVMHDIKLTPAQFGERMNAAFTEIGSQYRVTVNVEDGDVQNTFQYNFNKTAGLVGSVHKETGMVREVMLVGGGFDQLGAGEYIVAMGVTIRATNPEIPMDQTGRLLMDDLQMEKVVNDEVEKTETVKSGIRYTLRKLDDMFYFTVSNENE